MVKAIANNDGSSASQDERRISQALFRRVVLSVLIVLGLLLIVR